MTEINKDSEKIEPEKGLLKKGYNYFTAELGFKNPILTDDKVFEILSSKPGTEKY
ncbi:hypothetical protein EOM39_02515 [Candidatus Gracilibacteria bacterium]|nr:hypothetical protein [Candidatus Gracilibacteria bacterium]